jgi:regulator of protease activity HflC (stomatin/prohibitin superfamily)
MGWIIMTLALALLVVGAMVATGARLRAVSEDPGDVRLLSNVRRGIVVGAILVWVVMTFFAATHQIEAGHVGVVYQFGSIEGQISEGLQFTAPWQSVAVADIRVQSAKFERMSAASSETQDVFVTATLNYSVSPDAIQSLYRTVGPGWFDRLVEARVLNFFKEETVKYKTVDVLPNREAIRSRVRGRLIDSLSPYSVTVVDLLIDNISFNEGFTNAIEQKQIATQEALREQELIRVAAAQADQRIETARGEAEAVLIAARAQSDANRLLNASLSPQVIQYTAIQNLSDNVQLVLVPSNGNFLFNLSKMENIGP